MEHQWLALVTAVEDAFGLAIPDRHAEALNTAGELHDYVLAHRYGGKQEDNMAAMVFYKLRRGMMWVLKLEREDVQASQNVMTLIPARRHRAWKALQRATGLRLPLLRRPAWVARSAAAATFAAAIAVPMLLSLGPLNGAILVGLLTALVAGRCLYWLTIPLTVELQPDCATVGQLATATLARNYRAVVAVACKPADETEVWNLTRTILAEHSGIPFRDITRQTDLHRNLVTA